MMKSLVLEFFTVITYPSFAELDEIMNDFCLTNKFMIGNDLPQPFFTWLI